MTTKIPKPAGVKAGGSKMPEDTRGRSLLKTSPPKPLVGAREERYW